MPHDNELTLGVLVVDDDPNNVDILELHLEDENYNVFTACDGVDGWEKLHQHKDDIQVILLDRMMPNMDGMEFMAKLTADASVANIPVIMQTAAAEKEQVAEGIAAGVYYYLTKPYQEQDLLAIVRAATSNYTDLDVLRKELNSYKSRLNIVKECYFEVKTFDDIRYLSTFLANFYPNPERVVLGLSELLLNAVEHGNLQISYEEKTQLVDSSSWEQEVVERQLLPEHVDKKVLIHYKRSDTDITVSIQDEGPGFDWQDYLEIDPERATHNHGRGVALAKMMSFDNLEYEGNGNKVICMVDI